LLELFRQCRSRFFLCLAKWEILRRSVAIYTPPLVSRWIRCGFSRSSFADFNGSRTVNSRCNFVERAHARVFPRKRSTRPRIQVAPKKLRRWHLGRSSSVLPFLVTVITP
jgi:hypothetical protein